MKINKKKGFSLMELMIVVAIIGILVAIAIPSYQTYTRRAHYTEVIQAATPYKLGVEECFQVTGELDNCVAGKNGIPNVFNSAQKDQLVDTVTISQNGKITVTPVNKYGIQTKDTYVLTPIIAGGRLTWHTSGGGVSAGYAN